MPVKEDLIALFATERNGVRLLSALGKALATYLVDVVGVEDVEEVKDYGTLEKTAIEAWKHAKKEGELPSIHAERVQKWAAPSMNAEEDAVTSSRLGLGGGGGGSIYPALTAEEVALGGPYGLTMLGQKNMQEDKANQNLSLLRIMGMSIGIELGRKVPPGELHGVVYGSDPRTCALVAKQTTAKIPTFSQILEAKDGSVATIHAHLTKLASAYADAGQYEETTLITGFYTRAAAAGITGWEATRTYMKSYLYDKFPGRGLPVAVDMQSAFSTLNVGSKVDEMAGLLKSIKEVEAKVGALGEIKSKLTALEQADTTLRRSLGNLERRVDGGASSSNRNGNNNNNNNGGNPRANDVCRYCNQKGHHERECPQKKLDEAARNAEA